MDKCQLCDKSCWSDKDVAVVFSYDSMKYVPEAVLRFHSECFEYLSGVPFTKFKKQYDKSYNTASNVVHISRAMWKSFRG